jgi:hypothetical protein
MASVVVALLPVAVASARAIDRGWVPVSDNAFIAIRVRDVLTDHHPLLGTGSSASLTAGTELNHPGPLLFDVLAAPATLFNSGAGLALGVALVNGLAVLGIATVARRRGGPLLVTAAMAITAALCWTMGSELLFDPWQPHSQLLPFLCFLMLAWSITCGDLAALPWAVGVGSLVLQTHLSYAVLVPALGAWAVLGLVLELRRRRRLDPGSWPMLRRRARWAATVGGAVLAVCWAQPLVEQFTSDGKGNLSRLVEGNSADTTGFRLGVQLVASVASVPPWWLRPSLREAWLPSPALVQADLPSLSLAAASLAVLAALLVWCARATRRRRDREASRAVATAAVALLAGLATAGRVPLGPVGIPPHQFRWLWPLAAFVSFALVATLARWLARGPTRLASLVGAFALATAVLAALNLPTSTQAVGVNTPEWSIPVVRELGRQMTALEGKGPLLVDDLVQQAFNDPYGTAVLAELQRRGVPFVVDDPGLVRQLGPGRRFNGENARAALFLRIGDDSRVTPRGARRVGLHEGLTVREQFELAALTNSIGDYIREQRLRLNQHGQAALEHGDLPTLRDELSGAVVDPEPLVRSGELVGIVRARFLVLDDGWTRSFERYASLRSRWDRETVALFLRPLGDAASVPAPIR